MQEIQKEVRHVRTMLDERHKEVHRLQEDSRWVVFNTIHSLHLSSLYSSIHSFFVISYSILIRSDLAYPVLVYPDPSPSERKSRLVTDLQHMPCTHTVCVFDYPVPSPIRIFFWKTDVCGYARSACTGVRLCLQCKNFENT